METLVLFLLWLVTLFGGILLGYRIARKNLLEIIRSVEDKRYVDPADWWKQGDSNGIE